MEPPSFIDPRQAESRRLIEAARIEMGPEAVFINTSHGYAASAPDLGALQTALEEQLKTVPRRSVVKYADDYVSAWVQRVKSFEATFEDDSLVIDFKTKDDHGWYVFQFAVLL